MGKINVGNLKLDKVSMTVSDSQDAAELKLVGEIDVEDPTQEIKPFFNKLHEGIVAAGLKTVNVDVLQLSFMNSSGIKEMVNWIMKVNVTPAPNKYKINLIYSRSITWQESSLPVLQKLHPDVVEVKPV